MDPIVIGFIAVVVLGGFAIWVFRKGNVSAEGKGLGGLGFGIKGDNRPNPGIDAEGIKSRKGAFRATEETGKGLRVKDVEAEKDVELKTRQGDPDPKP